MYRFLRGWLACVLLLGIDGPWEAQAARIRAWGWTDEETYPVPEGDDFVAIAAGAGHNVALREDGAVVQWGPGVNHQWPIPEEKGFVAIAAGRYGLSAAVRTDGSLAVWGPWHIPPEGNDHIAVGLGIENLMALSSDGSYTQVGHCNSMKYGYLPPPYDYTAIDVEGYVSTGLRADGSVLSASLVHDSPELIPTGNDFVAVAAGRTHSLALREDGTLVAWASDNSEWGELDVPTDADFVAIAAGERFNLALRADGSIAAWGMDTVGQLDVPDGNRFVAISAYGTTGLALEVPEPSTFSGLSGIAVVALVMFPAMRRRRRMPTACIGQPSAGGTRVPPYGFDFAPFRLRKLEFCGIGEHYVVGNMPS